jgi:hypothetical protein
MGSDPDLKISIQFLSSLMVLSLLMGSAHLWRCGMNERLSKILIPNHPVFADPGLRRRLNFYLFANISGMVVMIGFGIALTLQGRVLIPATDFTCCAILFTNYIYLRQRKKTEQAFLIASISFMVFLLIHLLSGGTGSSGPIWFVIFPPVVLYLLGTRVGAILSVVLALPVLVILILLVSGYEFAGYTITFLLRFLIAYLMETALFYIMESQRDRAVKEAKLLNGLLPICSGCKKIRDDKGYWNDLESYIEKRSDAYFSHSLCAECFKALYEKEEWYDELKEKYR